MGFEVSLVLTIIGLVATLLTIAYILDKEHFILKLFYIIMALFFILEPVSMQKDIMAVTNSTNFTAVEMEIGKDNIIHNFDTVYKAFLVVIIVTLVYILLYFLIVVMQNFGKKNKGTIDGDEDEHG